MRFLHWMPAVVGCSLMNLWLPGLATLAPMRVPSQDPTTQVTPVSSMISEAPNVIILELPPINLFNEVPSKDDLIKFGTLLLDDPYGTRIKRIEEEYKYSMYEMTREICRQWLRGSGKHPVTWNILIRVLKQTQLLTLAGRIESSIGKEVLNKAVIYSFADSDTILRTAMFLREVYSIQHITEFNLFNDVGDVPFLDVIAKDDNSNTSGTHWKSFIYQETLPNRLLITGWPGTGKTTLLRYIAKKWAEGKALQTCEILFLIHLGRMKHRGEHSWNSLSDMLTSSHKDLKDIQHIAQEINSRHGKGACFLFNAYDEWYHNDYVYDVFFQQILKDSFCILSSRYIETDNGLINVELLGFADRSLEHYVTVLTNDSKVAQSVLELWKKYPSVRSMCTLPLHLAMVVFIMRHVNSESMPEIQTRAQIYTAFMNMTIKHSQPSHHPSWNTVSLRHCILNIVAKDNDLDLCNAFQTLQRVAFEMLFMNIHLFSHHSEIQRNLKTLNFLHIRAEPSSNDQVH